MKSILPTTLKALSIAVLIGTTNIVWAGLAGNVVRVNGDANAKDAKGQIRPLNADSAVNEGDTIQTAKDSSIQIQMKDGALMAMTGDAALKVVAYQYDEANGTPDKIDLVLEKGRFRTITGAATKENYSLSTLEGKVAINGTTFDILRSADGTTTILRNGEVKVTALTTKVVHTLNVPGMALIITADGQIQVVTEDDILTGDLDDILPLLEDKMSEADFTALQDAINQNQSGSASP